MSRPDDISQDVWDAAGTLIDSICDYVESFDGWNRPATVTAAARAIMAERLSERERCAKIADAYAEENIAMAGDTILMDPILRRRPEDGPVTVDELDRAEDLMIGGTIHSSMFHAAQNIAAAIRAGA